MNVPRYIIAGSASVILHAAFLFVAQESKVFAMPAGSQSKAVSINFVASAPASSTPPKATEAPTQETSKEVASQPEVQTATAAEAPQASTQKLAPVKKNTAKSKPATKVPTPKAQNKSTKTASKQNPQLNKTQKKEIAKKQPVKQVQPPTPEVETIKEPEKVQQQTPAQVVNNGVSNAPVLVQKPSFARKPSPPRYPRMARKRGIEGVATYEIWLDKEGKQIKQALVDSSGALMLDKAALDAIKKWKFSAHIVNGQAIAHRIQIPVRFKLD
ncbi:energy transducer TonB [Vibrio makurazakiensis]|uniref:energy transducer TonB n=1 Tax=Vibrio makurazakiensis TaxID=2910250 RepID=UPI003D106F84